MASGATPHFHNDMGLSAIEIGAREFMCIGARPPFDHPHVFLDMGEANEIVCPYCSTLYKFNASLGAAEANPAEAMWHDQAA
ncbi:MAG: zinc-finger domain-containing protein [Aestuariivirga sp.]